MSLDAEEDSELRDLVAQTLQSCGILGKIKAQLRSNVYLALDGGKDHLEAKSRLTNDRLAAFVKTSEGRLAVHLVREFLAFFDLNFTLSVFEPEAIEGREPLSSSLPARSRQDLIERLGLATEMVHLEGSPLISEIIRLSKVSVLKSETPSPTEFIEESHRTDSSQRTSMDTHGGASGVGNASAGAGAGGGRQHSFEYGAGAGVGGGSLATTPTQSLTEPESSLNAFGSLEQRHQLPAGSSNVKDIDDDDVFATPKAQPQAPPPPSTKVGSVLSTIERSNPPPTSTAAHSAISSKIDSNSGLQLASSLDPSPTTMATTAASKTAATSATTGSASSFLADLPPLLGSGSGSAGGASSQGLLAPIKRPPKKEDSLDLLDEILGKSTKSSSQESFSKDEVESSKVAATKAAKASAGAGVFSAAVKGDDGGGGGGSLDDEVEEEEIEEDFNLSEDISIGVSASDGFTKDESLPTPRSEESASIKADYVENLK